MSACGLVHHAASARQATRLKAWARPYLALVFGPRAIIWPGGPHIGRQDRQPAGDRRGEDTGSTAQALPRDAFGAAVGETAKDLTDHALHDVDKAIATA